MSTQSTEERADKALRDLLAEADPVPNAAVQTPTHLLDRVLADSTADPAAAGDDPAAADASDASRRSGSATTAAHRSFLRRHWQGALVAAASVCTIALAAPTVLPGIAGSGSDDSGDVVASAPQSVDGVAREGLATVDAAAPSAETGGAVPTLVAAQEADDTTSDQRLVRSANLLVGTDDTGAARDRFVATVLSMGGRVTSESVITRSEDGVLPYAEYDAVDELGMSMPYPWYPTLPGIWLSVEVPADRFQETVEAARAAGDVVRMQQSSYDVGTQMADVDARIAALEASLQRLTALMGEAKDVSDVIALEQAISQRQSQLDALRARQRDLANQTAMSRISLTLMDPDDAEAVIDPNPQRSWWESFLDGLAEFWAWLGQALLIVSPLLLAGAIIWTVRRLSRRGRRASSDSSGARPTTAGEPARDATTEGSTDTPGTGDGS